MKQTITYERTKITVDYPTPIRKKECVACHRKRGEGIKMTALHHTVYKYTVATVKKNPILALQNTLELCFGDHRIADAFRDLLLSNPRGALRSLNRIMQVVKLLPEEQRDHFSKLCVLFLNYWRDERRR